MKTMRNELIAAAIIFGLIVLASCTKISPFEKINENQDSVEASNSSCPFDSLGQHDSTNHHRDSLFCDTTGRGHHHRDSLFCDTTGHHHDHDKGHGKGRGHHDGNPGNCDCCVDGCTCGEECTCGPECTCPECRGNKNADNNNDDSEGDINDENEADNEGEINEGDNNDGENGCGKGGDCDKGGHGGKDGHGHHR